MTNAELRQLVQEELEWEPSLEEGGIGIAAEDGVITLSGYVKTYTERSTAEQCARRITGVSAVLNDIEVQLAGPRSDESLQQDAARMLASNVNVPHERIKVSADHGWIKLEGNVTWDFQRRAAERAVRDINGVRGITNAITIEPSPKPGEISDRIQDAFKRNALISASHINVTADNNTVVLSGHVGSWHERVEAERQAWAAPGVANVVNQLRIATLTAAH